MYDRSIGKRSDGTEIVVQLNEQQIKLIEHTTRYVALLTIGIMSSIIVMLVCIVSGDVFGEDWNMEWFQVAYIFVSIDMSINTLCLYLQYSFATKWYQKWCKCVHLCWRCMLTHEATKTLSKRYQKVLNAEEEGHGEDVDEDGYEVGEEAFMLNIKPDGTRQEDVA